MADKKHILTYAGLKKYEDELQDLKVNRRREIAQKIKEAREQGDLSENAEYDAAKDEQRDIELRIEELEKLLKNAEVVVEDEIDLEKISVGCQVKVLEMDEDEEMEFRIVGSTEANSLQNKISNGREKLLHPEPSVPENGGTADAPFPAPWALHPRSAGARIHAPSAPAPASAHGQSCHPVQESAGRGAAWKAHAPVYASRH